MKQIDDWLDSAQPICSKTDGKTKYDFKQFYISLKVYFKNVLS